MKRFSMMRILAVATLGLWLVQAQSDKPSPDALRERAGRLEEKAADLKAAGRHDEARQAMRAARELQAQADRIRNSAGPFPSPERAQALKRQHERVAAEVKELRASGKEEEAKELQQKLNRIERELDSMRDLQGQQSEARRAGRSEPPPTPGESQRRLKHLQAAIENLRAGGFDPIAERLARERDNLQRQALNELPGVVPMAEIRRLRMELQELRDVVRALERRLGENPPRERKPDRKLDEGRPGRTEAE